MILIAGFALVMAHDYNGVYAGDHDGDGGGGIPLSKLAGKYAQAGPGSGFLCICFKPDFSATESCSTADAVPITASVSGVGQKAQEEDGESCLTSTLTEAFPGKLPTIVAVFHGSNKVTNYDPATGTGDESYTNYAGGKCIGPDFDSTGATVLNKGTLHFVASDNGGRVDFVVTTGTDSVGDICAFQLLGFNLKQK